MKKYGQKLPRNTRKTVETSSHKTGKFAYLVSSGFISEENLNSILVRESTEGVEIENIFIQEMKLKREDIGKSLELYYGIPYRGYSDGEILSENAFLGLNKNYLIKNNWTPLRKEKDKIVILIADPSDSKQQQICSLLNQGKAVNEKIEFRVGLKVDILDFINSESSDSGVQNNVVSYENGLSTLISELELEQHEKIALTDEEPPARREADVADSAIVRLVYKILFDAYQEGVSDIHIEPGSKEEPISIRYRKDGVCKVVQAVPFLYKQAILSRLKIMSKLDIAEKRLPQDGKMIMRFQNRKVEFRIAICPTVGGNEDAVIRILTDGKPLPLTKMRLSKRDLKLVKESTQKPYGLILAVGPTGSGKSTTLHSFLGHINSPEKKIWTAEDPVEITQDGLRQLQTNDKIGLTFPVAMRTFLRGDPDVIMVGEMRDNETCAIGLEAALTGHLVFSTLHTNSAPETITRLIDMGMEPLHFSDSLLLIVAQRLAHTLCIKCKKEYHPDKEEYELLTMEYGEDKFQELGIKYTDSLMLKRAAGCDYCEHTGYAGRIGLFEILQGTKELKRLIIGSGTPEQIRAQAISDGMTTLKQD
ncbi:MAG: GspE/PulE family protein, partial [Candidatus Neomarinimicrobiota bacterium]|nr:GspE/PulE family protein [Candidatus Neomarinimicrobiota bacterium]